MYLIAGDSIGPKLMSLRFLSICESPNIQARVKGN